MRIVIDLRWMRPAQAGGIENLSRSFLGELLLLDRTNSYRVLLPAEVAHDFDARHRDNFRFEAVDGPAQTWRRLRTRVQRRLGFRGPSDDEPAPDLVLSLSGYIVPDMFPHRNVLVFADLQHEYYPEFFTLQELDERRRVFGASIARADHVIAISEHTRQTLLERYRVAPERTTTAHLAADPAFHPERWQPESLPRVLRKYGLEPGYLIFPANTWPHKNHLRALEALARLRDVHGLWPSLVLTGAAKQGQDALEQACGRLGLESQVRFLGYCPLEDMPALYRGASALFYPSLFEGFGIPVVEAMWCGCPVVCSNRTSLPEIAADAAMLVDPLAPDEMAAALARLLGDEGLRATLGERGRRRARDFSWRAFALQVLRTLEQVKAGPEREAQAWA
jgi:glycosyltransferase involved in cell wall biosynthesis